MMGVSSRTDKNNSMKHQSSQPRGQNRTLHVQTGQRSRSVTSRSCLDSSRRSSSTTGWECVIPVHFLLKEREKVRDGESKPTALTLTHQNNLTDATEAVKLERDSEERASNSSSIEKGESRSLADSFSFSISIKYHSSTSLILFLFNELEFTLFMAIFHLHSG